MLSKKFKAFLMASALVLTLYSIFIIFSSDIIDLQDFSRLFWKSDLPVEYYVLSAEWADANPEIKKLLQLTEQIPIDKSDLKDRIAQQLHIPGGAFLKKIEDQVKDEYAEQFITELRKEIQADLKEQAANKKFDREISSFKIQEQLKAQYLKDNQILLKNEIIKEFLEETTDEPLKTEIQQLNSLGVDRNKYFQNILEKILSEYHPSGTGVALEGKEVPLNGLKEVTWPPKSRKELTKRRTKLTLEDFQDLKGKHTAYVDYLRSFSVPPIEVYSGDGIVLAAGKTHIIGALNVIIQLREMGSELPVEVVLDVNADYNERFCGTVLPKFGAKCLIIEDVLGPEIYSKLGVNGFPMKAIALVVSSFDNTIYLDSDNFPIKNVDTLLSSEPFLKTKFILWPDNWHKGVSPTFYDIAGLTAGEPIRRDGFSNEEPFSVYISRDKNEDILFHDLEGIPPFTSVESGQLVFSKREHFRSLFLALYYNMNGESYYYPLLFQGVFGAGDRETFVPALHLMNEPYYLTDWEIKFSGITREKADKPGEFYFDESTMVQRDPDTAMKFRASWRNWLTKLGLDSRLDPFQNGDYTLDLLKRFFEEKTDIHEPEPFFLHVHSPKINSVFNEVSEKARYDYETRFIKKIGDTELGFDLGPTDWELKFQAINAWSTCEGMAENAYWSSFELNQKEICKRLTQYVQKLKEDSNDVEAATLNFLKDTKAD